MIDPDQSQLALIPLHTSMASEAPEAIDLCGVDVQNDGNPTALIHHAIRVISAWNTMHQSAVNPCISIALCREAFDACSKSGWEDFSQKNFGRRGMTPRAIRSALQSGRVLINIQRERGELPDLSDFARSTVHALTSSDESIVEKVIDGAIEIKEQTGRAPTQREVTALVADLQAKLRDAEGALSESERMRQSKDESIQRFASELKAATTSLNSIRAELDAKEREIAALRQQKDKYQIVLPSGVKDEQEWLESLANERQTLMHSKLQIEEQIEELNRRKSALAEEVSSREVVTELIDELEE